MDEQVTQFNPETSKVDEDEFVEKFGDPSWKFGIAARLPFERMALKGLLFAAGQQWLDLQHSNSTYFTRRNLTPTHCETVVRTNNRIPAYERSIHMGLSRGTPDFEAVPAPNLVSPMDAIGQAQVATRVLKSCDIKDNEKTLRRLEESYMMNTGECTRLGYWDTKAGRKGFNEGDEQTKVVNLFNYVIDPFSVDIWPPRWLIHYDARHVDEINALYPGKEKAEPEDVSDVMRNLDRLAMNIQQTGDAQREDAKYSSILKNLYVPPSEKYPDGHVWVWAGKKLKDHHDLQAGRWCWSRAQWFALAGRLYGMGLVEWIIGDQMQLNLMLSQLQEVANRQLRGDIVSAGTMKKAVEVIIDAKTGRKQIMLPPGTEKWDIMRYDQVWQNSAVLYEWLLGDMDGKVGGSKSFLGQDYKKDTLLGEMQIALERDLESLAWHMEALSEHWAQINRQKLALIAEYTANYRPIEGAKANEMPYYTGTDLGDTRDVVAIPVPHLTPAMKRQAETQARAERMMGPYESPQEQWASRQTLRRQGLSELEEVVAEAYGPLDELQLFVARLEEQGRTVLTAQADAAVEMALNPPQMPQEGAPGAQGGAGGPGMAQGEPQAVAA